MSGMFFLRQCMRLGLNRQTIPQIWSQNWVQVTHTFRLKSPPPLSYLVFANRQHHPWQCWKLWSLIVFLHFVLKCVILTYIVIWLAGPSRGWGKAGLATPGPATFGSPAVDQKCKVRHNVPFKKFKNFLPRGVPWKCLRAPQECFPRPHCVSRRDWLWLHIVDEW